MILFNFFRIDLARFVVLESGLLTDLAMQSEHGLDISSKEVPVTTIPYGTGRGTFSQGYNDPGSLDCSYRLSTLELSFNLVSEASSGRR